MRRSMLFVSLLGGLMMFFQNCAPPMKAAKDSINGGTNSLPPNDGVGATIDGEFQKTAASSYATLTLFDNEKTIEIDIDSGVAEAFAGTQRLHERYCFQAADLQGVRELLSGAQVCEPVQPYRQNDGVMCTQVYSYPYAALGEGAQRINLGERFNGCHQATDLCEGGAAALKSKVDQLKALLASRACD